MSTFEDARRENWMAAVRKGETTSGLAEWKDRPRATIHPSRSGSGFSIRWSDWPVDHAFTWWGAKWAARRLERQHRRCIKWNEATA